MIRQNRSIRLVVVLKWAVENQMKQLIMFVCAALLFSSCQKDETSLPINGDGLVKGATKSVNLRLIACQGCDANGLNCQYCECGPPGGNCLPDVVILGSHLAAMDDVFSSIHSGTQATIQAAFSANKTVLANYLALTDINAVINGTAEATAALGPNDSRFILIRDSQGNMTAAYPLYK